MKKLRFLLFLIILSLFIQFPSTAGAVGYKDTIPSWCSEAVTMLSNLEIINGYPDGTFKPDNLLKRGEFVKMLAISTELVGFDYSVNIHWAQPYWNMLNDAGVLETQEIDSGGKVVAVPLFPLAREALEAPITRYEMALLISNTIYNLFGENTVELQDAAAHIKDYETMDVDFKNVVVQAYGKGILTGYEDTAFHGESSLKRSEAAVALVRLLWSSRRIMPDFAQEVIPAEPSNPEYTSFAFRYREMDVIERRLVLFGNAEKTYFESAADASGWMVTVEIPIWKMDAYGGKYASRTYVTVHKLVAQEVKLIFEEIFKDPEKFPINSVGGARYSDTMRHSWGCAIDINPNENYYLHFSSGRQTGDHWLPGQDPYSITPNGSVVRAFAKYGWGWGGQGWTSAVDYMHFSILSSGG